MKSLRKEHNLTQVDLAMKSGAVKKGGNISSPTMMNIAGWNDYSTISGDRWIFTRNPDYTL